MLFFFLIAMFTDSQSPWTVISRFQLIIAIHASFIAIWILMSFSMVHDKTRSDKFKIWLWCKHFNSYYNCYEEIFLHFSVGLPMLRTDLWALEIWRQLISAHVWVCVSWLYFSKSVAQKVIVLYFYIVVLEALRNNISIWLSSGTQVDGKKMSRKLWNKTAIEIKLINFADYPHAYLNDLSSSVAATLEIFSSLQFHNHC